MRVALQVKGTHWVTVTSDYKTTGRKPAKYPVTLMQLFDRGNKKSCGMIKVCHTR